MKWDCFKQQHRKGKVICVEEYVKKIVGENNDEKVDNFKQVDRLYQTPERLYLESWHTVVRAQDPATQ